MKKTVYLIILFLMVRFLVFSKNVNKGKNDLLEKNFNEIKKIIEEGQNEKLLKYIDFNNLENSSIYRLKLSEIIENQKLDFKQDKEKILKLLKKNIDIFFDNELKTAIMRLNYKKLKQDEIFKMSVKNGIDVTDEKWEMKNNKTIVLTINRYVTVTEEEAKEFEKRDEDFSAGREWTMEYIFQLKGDGILKIKGDIIAG